MFLLHGKISLVFLFKINVDFSCQLFNRKKKKQRIHDESHDLTISSNCDRTESPVNGLPAFPFANSALIHPDMREKIDVEDGTEK